VELMVGEARVVKSELNRDVIVLVKSEIVNDDDGKHSDLMRSGVVALNRSHIGTIRLAKAVYLSVALLDSTTHFKFYQ
jgi:hypothetical protein